MACDNAASARCKEKTGTDVDTVALQHICLDFMGGHLEGTASVLAQIGMEKALEAFAEAFPSANLSLATED
jgi:hypothetical protein